MSNAIVNKSKVFYIGSKLLVPIIIFISKFIGFIREIFMSNAFGNTVLRDAYESAYTVFYIPILLLSSCISAALTPLYIKARETRGQIKARRFSGNVIAFASLTAIALSIVMMLLSKPLIKLIYYGFDQEKLELTAELLNIMLPALVFFAISLVLTTLLNAHEKFVTAQLTGIPLSFCVIFAILFVPQMGIKGVAWGVFFSAILQLFVLIPAYKAPIRPIPNLNLKDDSLKKLIILAGPAMLSMAVNELNHIIDRSLASVLNTGDISAMHSAFSLITFILGVIMVPITTISFTGMSKKAANKHYDSMAISVGESLELMLFLSLPIMVVGIIQSYDIIRLAFMRGAFTEEAARTTAAIFVYYLIGVFAFGIRDLLNRAFHALQETLLTLYVSIGTVIANITLNLILRKYMGANGLAFATSISCAMGAVVLYCLLGKRLTFLNKAFSLKRVAKIVISAMVSFAACLLLNKIIPMWQGTLGAFLRLFVIGLPTLIIYIAVSLVQKVEVLTSAVNKLLHKI